MFFDHRLLKCLSQVNKFPNKWEVMLLGYQSNPMIGCPTHSFWYKQQLDDNFIRRPAQMAWGTYGYCINTKGAKKLNRHYNNLMLPSDFYTGNFKHINLYLVESPIVLINEEMDKLSNLEHDRNLLVSKIESTMLKKILKKLKLFTFVKILYQSIKVLYIRLKALKRYE